jgi:TonB family protein
MVWATSFFAERRRLTDRLLRVGAVTSALLLLFPTIGATAPAEPVVPTDDICNISVNVRAIKEHPDEVAFTLWGDDAPGLASGDVVFFAGTERYRISFEDAVAAHYLDIKAPPTPIVVRFEGPATIDSAYVSSLDGKPCPIHSPYLRPGLDGRSTRHDPTFASYGPDWGNVIEKLVGQAEPMQAPAPETVPPPACAKPYVAAAMNKSIPPVTPDGVLWRGFVVVLIRIRADGSVAGVRIDRSSTRKAIDDAARRAAVRSGFSAAIFRCEPVSGNYRFLAVFES